MHDSPPAVPNGFRTFLIIWLTQSLSVIGSAVTFFSLTIWIAQSLYPRPEQQPELAFALSAVALAGGLPTVFGAPLAGAWADRHDRRRTMLVADLANGLLSVILLVLLLNQALQIWSLIIIVALLAVLNSFHSAAFDTSYAMLVPPTQLPRANGMMQTIFALSGIIAPSIAAILISLPGLGRQQVFFEPLNSWLGSFKEGAVFAVSLDAVTFFIASFVLLFLYVPSPKREDRDSSGKLKKSIWADIKEGMVFIRRRPPLLWLLATFTVINFAATPVHIFEPLLVKYNLASDWKQLGFSFEAALALLGTVGGLGGVAGGVFISAWGGLKKRRVLGVVIPIAVAGVVQTVYGFSPYLFLTAVCGFLSGALIPIMNSHSQSIWQTQTPSEMQGRVFSVRRLIAQFTAPLSSALAGFAGGLFNPGFVLAILGIITTLFAIGQLFNPYLLRVEDKVYLDELAAEKALAKAGNSLG